MIEDALSKAFSNTSTERSFIDKLLAKDDVAAIREIIKKPRLNRQDMTDLLYLLSSNEIKLLNYGDWDRYVMMKFFVWIREFFKSNESLFDYKDDLEKKENTCINCHKLIITDKDKCICSTDIEDFKYNQKIKKLNIQRQILKKEPLPLKMVQERILKLDEDTKQIFENNVRLMEHNIKFLVDLYFQIGRSTLSLGGTGLLELLKNKFEVAYPNTTLGTSIETNKTGGIFRK